MQTFLPYASFQLCATVLDTKRLGKQRVESYQILRTLTGESTGWRQHPATRMWSGHAAALGNYTLYICEEWRRRGYNDTVDEKVRALLASKGISPVFKDNPFNFYPPWFADAAQLEKLTSSHRANLLRKLPQHYARFGWTEEPTLPYFWPAPPAPLPPLPEVPMSDAVETPVTTSAVDANTIDALIASLRNDVTSDLHPQAVARANKRINAAEAMLHRTVKSIARQRAIIARKSQKSQV